MRIVVGYVTATFLMPTLELAILFWSLACVFDDVGWIYIYIKNKKSLIADDTSVTKIVKKHRVF